VFATAVNAGTMPSRSGNASVAPIPRNIVRRDNAFLVVIIMARGLRHNVHSAVDAWQTLGSQAGGVRLRPPSNSLTTYFPPFYHLLPYLFPLLPCRTACC